jgi:7-carboxy-7-deazaguanine synthase
MTILVSEIYGRVIQGEGMVAGRPTVFVRTGGCDYRCGLNDETGSFDLPFVCDSLYAVLGQYKNEWRKLSADEILAEVSVLAKPPTLITLSGGNPALHDFTDLISKGHELGYVFAVETQGTKLPSWAQMLDSITISPKPPSSGMKTDWAKLKAWLTLDASDKEICVKVVVFDDEDFDYAADIRYMANQCDVPMFLQAGTSDPYGDTATPEGMAQFRDNILKRTDWLGKKVIEADWSDVRVLPQIHALLYGAKRGV